MMKRQLKKFAWLPILVSVILFIIPLYEYYSASKNYCYSTSFTAGIKETVVTYLPIHVINKKFYDLENSFQDYNNYQLIDFDCLAQKLIDNKDSLSLSTAEDIYIAESGKSSALYEYCYQSEKHLESCKSIAIQINCILTTNNSYRIDAMRMGNSDNIEVKVCSPDSSFATKANKIIVQDYVRLQCLKEKKKNIKSRDSLYQILDKEFLALTAKNESIKLARDSIINADTESMNTKDLLNFWYTKSDKITSLTLKNDSIRKAMMEADLMRTLFNMQWNDYVYYSKLALEDCQKTRILNTNINKTQHASIKNAIFKSISYALIGFSMLLLLILATSLFSNLERNSSKK